MLALLSHHHNSGNQIVDEAKAPGFPTCSLNLEAHAPGGLIFAKRSQTLRELRYHVLDPHIRTIGIMWAENQDAVEEFAPEINSHNLADQLTGAVGITRVERIGHAQRRGLIC